MKNSFRWIFESLRSGAGKMFSCLEMMPAWLRRILISVFSLFLLFLAADAFFPVRTEIAYSQLVYDRNGGLAHAFLSRDDKWRMQISPGEVSPMLVKAIISKEDRWFRLHPGVNPFAVGRAAWQNITRGERVSGASTITMQVVRLLEPRKRTRLNKMLEMFRALQLEFHLPKDEILALYLNLLPFGGNIEGVKAASYLYFGQAPQALSPAQVVALAIVPNNPQHLRLEADNALIIKERNKWLKRLAKSGIFTASQLEDALSEPLDACRRPAPASLPHFSLFLQKKFKSLTNLRTWIDPDLQDNVENILGTEVNRYRNLNITNASVMVIDNSAHAVIAYAGSAGFDETLFQGQVDGVQALRSPGSALKPFLYAQAIDMGLVTPRTMVTDVPVNYNGYRPLNNDEEYRGILPVSDALALSLNIPAVDLASRVGTGIFMEKLSRGGLTWIGNNRKKLGLSVALGGCGVTLMELTRLYACLASGGENYPLRLLESDAAGVPDTLYSAGSAWMITGILTGLKRPDLPSNFENSLNKPKVAWKTGTSYGRRDAWSIGYNPRYTVGVWVGNFDGTGAPDLSGSEFAAPVLFRIFDVLMRNSQSAWFPQPGDVDFRLVCSESGLPPSGVCKNLVVDYFLPGISPNRRCTHLAEVFTDEPGKVSYCRSCLPDMDYKTAYYPNLPPALISYYEEEAIPYEKIPPHNPGCSRVFTDASPVITSLTDGKEYILYKNAKQQLQLSCAASPDASRIFWYVNDKFIGEGSPAGKMFFRPEQGSLKISCSDDRGRNRNITIRVTWF